MLLWASGQNLKIFRSATVPPYQTTAFDSQPAAAYRCLTGRRRGAVFSGMGSQAFDWRPHRHSIGADRPTPTGWHSGVRFRSGPPASPYATSGRDCVCSSFQQAGVLGFAKAVAVGSDSFRVPASERYRDDCDPAGTRGRHASGSAPPLNRRALRARHAHPRRGSRAGPAPFSTRRRQQSRARADSEGWALRPVGRPGWGRPHRAAMLQGPAAALGWISLGEEYSESARSVSGVSRVKGPGWMGH